MRVGEALLLAGWVAATASCRKPCDYVPSPPGSAFLLSDPSNHEQHFWVELDAPQGSCDEGAPEFRDVRMEVFDEEGKPVPPSRIEYSYAGTFPHSTTEIFVLDYWVTVPHGGDYRFHARFPDAGWPDQSYTYMVPQHHGDAPVVVLPRHCSSVGSLGPELWLCDGALFHGDQQQWLAPSPDGGVAISRAVGGVAWVHAGSTVYRFEGDATTKMKSASLARAYEALSATASELFLQSPAGVARVTFDGQSLSVAEADFEAPLVYEDEIAPAGGRYIPPLVHGVQASNGILASLWMYGRAKVRACRWSLPSTGLPALRADECVEEGYYFSGAGSSGAWVYNGEELAVRDYTTRPPTSRYTRPVNFGPDPGPHAYETNRRWLGASARPKPDGSIAFDSWDISNQLTSIRDACMTSRWDAEDDLAWVACGYAPFTAPVYTLVWRRPLGTP